MDRRKALFSIAMATGGVTLLSRCSFGEERLPIALDNLKVSIGEEDLLKELVAVILPETDLPGASSLEVHNFVWVMADDCMDKKGQETFMSGLRGFKPLVETTESREYTEFKDEEKANLLSRIAKLEGVEKIPANNDGDPMFDVADVQYFLNRTKGYTIRGFMQSEYIMTEIMPYALVPGGSTGCSDVDPSKRVNING